jgi:hypothetical protein
MSSSATLPGRRRPFAAIGILLIVLLASLLVSLRAARDDAAPDAGARARDAAASRAASRRARVRQLFIDIKGRDPAGWDEASVDRWTRSPLGTHEIARRLRSERPLVGVHYFTWYRPGDDGGEWGSSATAVPAGTPMPALGWYDSNDTDVMDAHISQIATAGFDFVILNVVAESPESWAVTKQFFNQLRGTPLRAAVMLDGLYDTQPFAKALWVKKAVAEFTAHPNYFMLHGRPLLAVFAAPIDFAVPGITLRNVYWAPEYAPGANRFNPSLDIQREDWPFWAPTPQPLVNGVVPVIPGYHDTHLKRERQMEHPRRDGRTYHEQWQRALAQRPELVIVYSWNEHFEQTAIEPTEAWGDRYLQWTACYAAHARRGTTGTC